MAWNPYGDGIGPLAYPPPSSSTTTGSTAAMNASYGKRVPVVYGTAVTNAVYLTVEDHGTGLAKMDGINEALIPLCRVQAGLAHGIITGVEGWIYQDRLYGPTTIASHQLDEDWMGAYGSSPSYTVGDPASASTWSVYAGSTDDNELVPYGHVACFRHDYLGSPEAGKPDPLKSIVRGLFATRQSADRETYLDDHWDIYDANPAEIIVDLIENDVYGLGMPAGTVEVMVGADGEAASSYFNACQAYGLFVALAIQDDVQVAELISQLLQATNAVGFWEGATFKVVPLFDTAKTANGVTYNPVLEALEIDDDHLVLDGENPILGRRRSFADTYNVVPVRWTRDTPTRDEELVTTEDMNTANADEFGVRRGDPVELPCIRYEDHAVLCSRWMAERSLYNRTVFQFTVTPRAAATIQVGDLLSLVHIAMGLNGQLVRVTETDEDARGNLQIKAVEWHTAATITINALPRLEDGE